MKPYENGEDDGAECASDESLPGLFGGQLDEGRFAEEEPEHVGHDVAADDHRNRHQEPGSEKFT